MQVQTTSPNQPHWALRSRTFFAILLFLIGIAGPVHPHAVQAQQAAGTEPGSQFRITPIRTESPRDVLSTFLLLRDDMEAALVNYTTENSVAGAVRLAFLSDQMVALFDLDLVPRVSRREVGIKTATYLMDIFGRIDPPALSEVPDQSAMEEERADFYRIEGTPFRIVFMATGEREGEYLFSGSTVQAAPRFLRGLMDTPLRSPLDIESYTAFSPQLTGPLIPAYIVLNTPESLKTLWFGTPAWKVLATAILAAVTVLLIAILQRVVTVFSPKGRLASVALRTVLPLAIIGAVTIALPYFSGQINLSAEFASTVETIQSVIGHVAYAWLFLLCVRIVFEWVILSPRVPDESLDANLLRLLSGVIGIIGAAVILAFGGQAIGLPIVSVVAGLGIGGLAVALAIRPTLENLVGGVMLYIDRPVRVGDLCCFQGQMGTVEGIGIRSTKLRALDRTLITVPNAQFADMQIINFFYRDQILINETIGVRFETGPDQLRYLLAQLRELLIAHPMIDPETVRVRFSGCGGSALNINIRVYVLTKDFEDFAAIREDVLLRILDIVKETGTGFAFPSHTVYLSRDEGIDVERAEAANAAVAGWRRDGTLPFPDAPRDVSLGLAGTLDYPPKGSFGASGGKKEPVP